jgi:uncharacterized membrane protein
MDFVIIAILAGAVAVGAVKFYVESIIEENEVKKVKENKVETESK